MFVADTSTCVSIMFLNNGKHSAQESLLLDDCSRKLAKSALLKAGSAAYADAQAIHPLRRGLAWRPMS
jgi:hypothetical protein